jgi:hypothetical protein
MIICHNELSVEEIQIFKNYWNNNQDSAYINWVQDNQVLDRRLTIEPDSPEMSIIKRIVGKYFDKIDDLWSAYQRQNFCHNIHIDDYGNEQDGFIYTFVLSLDTEPRFKTIVWKEQCASNEELHKYINRWGEERASIAKKTNISDIEDLDHTYDENQQDYMCDYLDLDGVYTYKAGSGVLFNAKQFHCTSNWKKYSDIPYRDLLQIHVASSVRL